MKKFAIILLAVLLTASFAACSCGENDSEKEKELRVETGYSSDSDWTNMY